jgi:hypothetical protein
MREERDAAIYEAAERWKDVALRGEDSLFTPGTAIWAPGPISDIYSRFVEHPDESKRSFEVKFEEQLAGAPPTTLQLAGELLLVHLLIDDATGGNAKRALINKVLGWSPEPVSIPSELASVLDRGIVDPGPGFRFYRPHQLWFIIELIRRWETLEPDERVAALEDPWRFKELLHSLPQRSAFSEREALLHLVHPDTFESITSVGKKEQIVKAFSDYVDEDTAADVDEQLLDIRRNLGAELSNPQFSYWDPDVHKRWNPPKTPGGPPEIEKKGTEGEPPEPGSIEDLANELYLDAAYLNEVEKLLRDRGQIIFHGPPGTGKTYVARKLAAYLAQGGGSVEFVQFHPSYAYEDFVEGYRPREDGSPGFELTPGPLKRIADKAKTERGTHVLVIDEVNRGNVAKVFGEMYFLLEYRRQRITLQYSRETFDLPHNLFIIGTMNTADRSIALIDTALRRRFYFVPFFPSEPPVEGLLRRWLTDNNPTYLWVADVVDRANAKLGDPQLAIGPSYFMRKDLSDGWVELIWEHAVMPTIAEYYFGETERLAGFRLAVLRDQPGSAPQASENGQAADDGEIAADHQAADLEAVDAPTDAV